MRRHTIDHEVFAIGYLNETSLVHNKIVEISHNLSKGVFTCNLFGSEGRQIRNKITIGFAPYNQIRTKGKYIENNNISRLVKSMVKHYDREMVYCAAVIIGTKIAGSSLIPLQQPNRLKQLIDRAISNYENS